MRQLGLEDIPRTGSWRLTMRQSWRTLWRQKWKFERIEGAPEPGETVWSWVRVDLGGDER